MRALVACIGYLLLAPLPAFAEAVVTWTAAEECPAAAQSRAELVRLLGTPLGKIKLKLSASVRLQRSSPREFEATISIRSGGEKRERTLRDESCVVLAQAAAVVVALAIDPKTALPEASAETRAPEPATGARAAMGSRRAVRPQRPVAPKPASEAPPVASEQASGAPPVEPERASGAPPVESEQASGAPPVEPEQAPATPSVEPEPARAAPSGEAALTDNTEASPSRSIRAESTFSRPSRASGRPRHDERAKEQSKALAPRAERAERAGRAEARSRLSGPRGTQAALGAGALLLGYVVPGIAPAITLQLGMLRRSYWGALRLLHAPAQRATLELPKGVGGRVALWAMALESGVRVRWSLLELPLIVGVEAGRMSARGVGVAESWSEGKPWLGASLGSGLSYVWRARLAVGVRVDGTIGLLRPRFGVRRTSGEEYEFHRPSRIGLRGYLTVELRLPWW